MPGLLLLTQRVWPAPRKKERKSSTYGLSPCANARGHALRTDLQEGFSALCPSRSPGTSLILKSTTI